MGTTTTNYNLYKPANGETGWGDAVNTSTDTVDTTMKANEDAVALNTTHRTSDGSDHSFLDQSVISGATPTFTGTNFTGMLGANVSIADAGGYYTATDVEGALQENRPLINTNTTDIGTNVTAIGLNTTHRGSDGKDHSDVVTNNAKISYTDSAAVGLNTTHRTSDGSDHTFIDQSVISGATPTFSADNLSDGGGNAIITTTQETNFEAAYTHVSSNGSDHSLVNSSLVSAINFVIDGGGSAITTGIKGDVEIPFACTINQVTLLADQSTTTTIDIWKDTYANFPPTVADTITAAAIPTITAALKDQDAALTGWTTSITAGDIIRFNVDANDTAERVTLSLKVTKT